MDRSASQNDLARYPFTVLMYLLLVLVAINPVLMETDRAAFLVEAIGLAVIVGAAAVVGRNRRRLGVALALAAPALVTRLWYFTTQNPALLPWDFAAAAIILSIAATSIFRLVITAGRVSADTVRGGVSVYLLMGVIWGYLFALLDLVYEDSFAYDSGAGRASGLGFFLYYSLVTLSTLGYGDVIPITPTARSLASTEAIMGQLFLAIFVAALVSRSSWTREGQSDR